MKYHSLKDIDNKVPKAGSFKHFLRIQENGGRVVKGVNTTADVGTNAIKKQAAKFGNTVDKDGRPPTLSKKVKGSKTNVLFNLGLAESDRQNNLVDFVDFCKEQLDLESIPTIKFVSDTENTTFGYFDNDTKGIVIQNDGRHQMDVMRTVAHELVHYKQDQTFNRELNGEDGSSDENQANSLAGVILRRWGQKNPSLFTESVDNTDESVLYYAKMAENLGEIASASKVYVDMDGVLADFFGEWQKLIGSDWRKVKDIEPALQKIRDKDNFWLDLPLLPQAKNLLGVIKKVKGSYTILSSPLPNDPNSEPHKREWIKNNLDFFPPENVIITHDKPKYAVNSDGTPNILIDDFGKNIASWEAAGGEGFKHKDHKFERTAKAIKQHMTEPVDEAFDTKINWEKDPEDHGDVDAYIAYIGYKEVGIQYFFEPINAGGVILPGLDITFEVNGATKKTGGGDASTIFGAVINHIKQFIEQHNEIDVIQFSASKEQGLSRTRLYSAMVDKLSKGTDWINAKTISKADKTVKDADMFKLVRRSAVNDKMVGVEERTLTKGEEKKKEKNVKGMKKNKADFKKRYGDAADDVMYATATKMAKESLLWSIETGKDLNESLDKIIQVLEEMDRRQFMKTAGKVGAGLGAAALYSALPTPVKAMTKDSKPKPKIIMHTSIGREFDLSDRANPAKAILDMYAKIEKIYVDRGEPLPQVWVTLDGKQVWAPAGSIPNANKTLWTKEKAKKSNDREAKINKEARAAWDNGERLSTQYNMHLIKFRHRYKESIDENFADGKKKGKSKPGRVKKSGASCSSSVTELRKKAKNASGERAKMYHWCANMKSGKKK